MIKKIRLAEKGTRLLDRVTFACARAHYSRQTEKAYRYWIKAYIFFHQKQHPSQLNASHLEAFINCLAVDRRVAAATQAQALNAVAFLYKNVLAMDLPWMENFTRAKQPERISVVFSLDEAQPLICMRISSTLCILF